MVDGWRGSLGAGGGTLSAVPAEPSSDPGGGARPPGAPAGRAPDDERTALPDLPPDSGAVGFLVPPANASTAQLVDLIRAAHYDFATGRITEAQHDAVMHYVGQVHEDLARRRFDARRGGRKTRSSGSR